MILLLLGTALAQDVAPKPEAREPLAGQCVESTPVSAPCGGVIVPTTTAADLLDIEIWGDQLYSQYTLDQKAWALQQDVTRRREQETTDDCVDSRRGGTTDRTRRRIRDLRRH